MSDLFIEPARETVTEAKIQKSRFIAHVCISTDETRARERIKIISSEHRQANHNCWAYRVGTLKREEYFSDDGEPAGTAGKPILGAILRQEMTNVLVVVTRYFGGIKLGVRGLIEAYGNTASEGLLASGKVLRRVRTSYEIRMPYDMAKLMDRLLDSCDTGGEFRTSEYGEYIRVRCAVPLDLAPRVEETLEEWKNTRRIRGWDPVG
jgi:uncharacterized YigZ family protein